MRKKCGIVVVCILTVIGIGVILRYRFICIKDLVQLNEIADMVLITEYSSEDIGELLEGISQKRVHAKWGNPDGHLSGFWGEIWFLDRERNGRITLYYDADGKVEEVIVDTAPGL